VDGGIKIDVKSHEGVTPLHYACYKGSIDIVKLLLTKLEEQNIDINSKSDKGLTLLHCAVINGSIPIIDLLIAKNIDINLKSDNGLTALDYAGIKGNFAITKKLIEIGAGISNKVDPNSYNFTEDQFKELDEVSDLFRSRTGSVDKSVISNSNDGKKNEANRNENDEMRSIGSINDLDDDFNINL
jgi:ankyrin repeat protein